MTSIATSGLANDISVPASMPKAVGQQQNGADPASFTELLATTYSPDRRAESPATATASALQFIDLLLEDQGDLQAPDVSGEKREAVAWMQPDSMPAPSLNAMQVAVHAAYLASVIPGNTDASAVQAADDASVQTKPNDAPVQPGIGLIAAQLSSLPGSRAGQSVPAQSDLTRVGPSTGEDKATNISVSERHATLSNGSLPTMVRQETHLVAAKSATAALNQFFSDRAGPESGGSSLGSSGHSPAEAAAGPTKSAPSIIEAEPVVDQVAGQVAGMLASLRGDLPANAVESAQQVAAVNRSSEPSADVVKTLRFELKPGELGEVHVRMSWSRNELRLHLSFANERAASIAQTEGQALKQVLADAGASVGQIVIDTVAAPRGDTQLRFDTSPAQSDPSGGATTNWSGADRERRSQQEAPRRELLREQSGETAPGQSSEKAGLFI